MKDAHLAFPLIAGLDFLQDTEALLDMGQSRYSLETGTGTTYHPFLTSQIPLVLTTTLMAENTHHHSAVALYYALPTTTTYYFDP